MKIVLQNKDFIQEMKYHLRNFMTARTFTPIFSDRLFLIFGCQRSGTTLLLSILNAHPKIKAIDETEFLSPYPFPSAPRLIINKISDSYLCLKILEHSNKLDFIKRFYPKIKILWPIRNPYNTIASMTNLVNSDGNWIDRCAIKEIERLKPFFSKELTQYNLSKLSNIELGAVYWLYKNKYPRILENQGFDILVFKYENLVNYQKETLQKIIDFLEIEWNNDLLSFYQKNPAKSLAGGTMTNQPINVAKANNLPGISIQDFQQINNICEPLIHQYDYILQ